MDCFFTVLRDLEFCRRVAVCFFPVFQDLGFKHVTIFERLGRVGGMSYTLYHRNVPHELGTVAAGPDYTEIYDLVREFKAGRILSNSEFVLWNKEKGYIVNFW